jgi:hypothetical protein
LFFGLIKLGALGKGLTRLGLEPTLNQEPKFFTLSLFLSLANKKWEKGKFKSKREGEG